MKMTHKRCWALVFKKHHTRYDTDTLVTEPLAHTRTFDKDNIDQVS